jgi:hypothetical protein
VEGPVGAHTLRELRYMADTVLSEPTLSLDIDDDLPRTIRREREAREARAREARERDAAERLSLEPTRFPAFERPTAYPAAAGMAGTTAALDVPFGKLMAFFVKAVFAALPALIILVGLLGLVGHALQLLFPDLVKLKVLIYMPK